MLGLTVFLGLQILFFMVKLNYSLLKVWIQSTSFVVSGIILVFFYQTEFSWVGVSMVAGLGLDQYNYILLVFLFWLIGLSLMSVTKINLSELFLFYLLMSSIFFSFSSLSLMVFYFFFEVSLIPMFMLLVMMGTSFKRLSAGLYMLFFTLFFSLPLMVILFYVLSEHNTLMINYMIYYNVDLNKFLYLVYMGAFMVKMPTYLVHIWLPKAHVEAPCCGSMILAGILLKLGTYGVLRGLMIMMKSAVNFSGMLISYSLVGSLVCSLICLRMNDLKMLVAYSSVVHMGVLLSGLMTMSGLGVQGALYMMVAHGFSSSGLFYLVNSSYKRTGSRMTYFNKGMINVMPSMSLWWFLLSSSNMAAPITLNLLSEIMLFISVINFHWVFILLIGLISFFSAWYTIYLYSVSQQGQLNSSVGKMNSGQINEYLCLFMHWVPLNMMVLNIELFF